MINAAELVKAREAKRLSQPALAKLAGCSQQLIGALEAGTTKSTKFLPKIATALEVDPGLLDSDWSGVSSPPPGQVAVVNPNLPYVGAKPYIFYAETESGTVRATVKRLRRQTGDTWHVTQHNPPAGQKHDFTLSRGLWRVAHRIVGRQDPS
jgi:transcriptional regulator with XRE-family HTH domain